jgi:hypothetical protein
LWQSLAWFYAYFFGDRKFYTLLSNGVSWLIWTMQNTINFDKYVPKSPVGVIFMMGLFAQYEKGFYGEEYAEWLLAGAQV